MVDADAGADAEVILTIGADVQRFFDDLAKEHIAAIGTAHPQTFGDAFLVELGRIGGLIGRKGHEGIIREEWSG